MRMKRVEVHRAMGRRERFAKAYVVVVLIGGLVGGHQVSAAAAVCKEGAFPVVDRKGDATRYEATSLFNEAVLPNEPILDIRFGSLKWNKAKKTVTFNIVVDDLVADPPAGSFGKFFRFWFHHAGTRYQISALSSDLDGTKQYALAILGDATATTLDHALKGAFDVKKDVIKVDLPVAKFNKAVRAHFESEGDKPAPAMKAGTKLGSFQVHAQRYVGNQSFGLTPNADTAVGRCDYIIR
jgi:hypothetical protein